MKYKKTFILTVALFGVLCIGYAQTKLINGITYEKIDSIWYQLYNGDQFEVYESIIIVKFVSGVSESQKNQIVQMNNCTIVRSNSLGYYDLEITDNTPTLEVVENFIANPSIEMAEPSTIGVFAVHATDTYYGEQWHLHEDVNALPPSYGIDAFKAWDKENGSPEVVIGILDTGTDILHEDLEGNIWVNPGEDLDGDGVVWDDDDMNGIDDDGNGLVDDLSGWDFWNDDNTLNSATENTPSHGTFVAGVAGAETNDSQGVAGVAGGWTSSDGGCKMLICKIGEIGVSTDAAIAAILYAVDKGTKIITLSFKIGHSITLEDIINSVYINNSCFIDCCSHNQDEGELPFPANVEHCFAVGGSDQNGLRWTSIYGGSNYGEGLMIIAPSKDIKSTYKDNEYGISNGTSFAAPQVGATAGLILSRFPGFTAQDIEEVLCLTAMKLPSYEFLEGYEYGSWNNYVGYGKLNADRAIGIKEDITSGIILEEGNYIIDEVHVSNNSTLTFSHESRFYLLKTGELYVDEGSTLIIEDDVKITGKGVNKIIINGNLQIGSNVSFIAEEGTTLQIEINNPELLVDFSNTTFTNAELFLYNSQTTISYSTFDNSIIYGYDGSLFVNETDFLSSSVYAQKVSESNVFVDITNCDFIGLPSLSAIEIENYPNFSIQNCSIINYRDAISLYNCGDGENDQLISNNVISENTGAGITMYRSLVDILHNVIENNNIGIRCFDRSNIHIEGGNYTTTQKIRDNDSYEILASRGSFPHYLHWNLIEDDDNFPGDPIVKYTGQEEGLDVTNNCWGDYFNPDDDLDPEGAYIWDPVWDCNTGTGSGDGSEAEQMYLTARDKIEAGDFAGAKADFQQIVLDYPTTKYAQAALKEIYSLEAFVSNDYADLKSYYILEPNITNNTELEKLADFLINFCEIKLVNWPTAISWFEGIIQNPESMEDSIFAIIDLGYTYFLMENGGLKSAYAGNMKEHIPKSVEQFEEKRDYLLSLLPGDKMSELIKGNIAGLKEGELLQNVPNPFKGSTQIWYKINIESNVQINIYNYTGQLISTINEETKTKGIHHIEFDANGIKNGIYFYSISINGQTTASKKMIVLE